MGDPSTNGNRILFVTDLNRNRTPLVLSTITSMTEHKEMEKFALWKAF